MNTQTRNVLITVIVLIVIGVLGYFAWKERAVNGNSSAATSTVSMSTSTLPVASSTDPGYTIKVLPISGQTPATPAYKNALVCASTIPADQCTQFQTLAASYAAQITKSPTEASAWINLGTVRESAGDYAGAIAAWNYVAALYPTTPTAFDNLGEVYLDYVHDYAKASSNFLTAIKLNPKDTGAYRNLFTLYSTTSYKPTAAAAEDILKQGISANTTAVDLQVLLARYYKSAGRTTDAKAEYAAAAGNATSQGETSLAAQIQAEKASF
jgi:tetratricopeptide (TPR) repeat protein